MIRTLAQWQHLAIAGAALASLTAAPAAAQEFSRFDGFVVDSPSIVSGFDSGTLTVRLTGATPDTELAGYAVLAHEKGARALRSELGKLDLGRVSLDHGLGLPIAIVQETRADGLRRVLLVVPRDVHPREVFRVSRTVQYPYVVIDATLDADGFGVGELYPVAKLEISPDGKLTYESWSRQPMRILKLRAS